MAHFARVVAGVVQEVIVADQEFINSGLVGEPLSWVKTSYNTREGVHYQPNSNIPSEDQSKALRKNYASIGDIYDNIRDAFYKPQPYNSWTLNEDTCQWECPVDFPTVFTYEDNGVTKGMDITWDEANIRWVNDQDQYWNPSDLIWVNI